MTKLHIAQDDHDYWMLSVEQDDGTMEVFAHQFASPDQLVEMAQELIRDRNIKASILIASPRSDAGAEAAVTPSAYTKPSPRRVGV
jgi:hypothetical protein